ncbi:microtubule-associated protein tau isoform X1 [Papilio machaon]|uniref:microtubule-associated protein tau isoform X1 n=1 Tax=Papilio machaon TaxID=76193 RepID=UPI001E66532E|nr:microtubule-associated protein tau isoform X1 [Papilio machaon]
MEQMSSNNVSRAPGDIRPPSSGPNGQDSAFATQAPVRPPLTRVDSRSALIPPVRPGAPQQFQQRPLFQPGGPVTSSPQFTPRSGSPITRGPTPSAAPGSPQIRAQAPPARPSGPQSIQGPRPQQSPTTAQPSPVQRAPAPSNLQFGPRQPPQFGGATTPDGSKAQAPPQFNGTLKNGTPAPSQVTGQLPRQPSQGSLKGLDLSNTNQSKTANLEALNSNNDNQNANKSEINSEAPAVAKGRSYSIAAAPGTPSPLKMDEDRRKSISAVGSKMEEFTSRSPGLGLIQESKDSRDNIRGSKDSVRSVTSNDGSKDNVDRPESRITGSRMTESIMGSLTNIAPKMKMDDDDDVVLQNNVQTLKNEVASNQNKVDMSDRSPSLTRSDDSPEPKNASQSSVITNKSQSATPEPQRPKTPKDLKPEPKVDASREVKPSVTPVKTPSKSPIQEMKTMPINKKPTELITPTDSKRSTPRKVVSAPKSRPKDGDNDSGVDESTQGNDMNGSPGSPNKKLPSKVINKEKSSNSLKTSLSRSSSKSATAKTPENPPPSEKKKVPMNKIQVGNAPSPNIKAVKSKIGSLDNATYKPGGGKVKIENRKLEFNATPKIAAKNEAYTPSGGTKKIITTKLEWNAKSKIGSLQNTAYKPGGGDKKIETVKLDFKDKAKPKVGSTANITHKPGGGTVKSTDAKNGEKSEDGYMSLSEWSEERPLSRSRSVRAPRTPRTPRALSPRKPAPGERALRYCYERERRASARPATARDPPRSSCSRRTSLTPRPAFSVY